MFLNLSRLRLGAMVAGLLLVVAWFAFGGKTGTETRISIEFGTDPDSLVGAEVEIDGKPVGKLERIGRATRYAFEVDPGEHTVRVVQPGFDGRPARVRVEGPGQALMLLAEIEPSYDPGGSGRPVLVLR